jgi:hypothetical protein
MMAAPHVEVIVQLGGEHVVAGQLWAHTQGRRETATFMYTPDYVRHPDAYPLDPILPLVAGPLQTPVGKQTVEAPAGGGVGDAHDERCTRGRLLGAQHRQAPDALSRERVVDESNGVVLAARQHRVERFPPEAGSPGDVEHHVGRLTGARGASQTVVW